jgi:hypothetical protein
MKRFCLFITILFLSSCLSSNQETNSSADSSTADAYEDFSEVSPFTIKDDIRNNAVTINGTNHSVQETLIRYYSPDTFTTKTAEDSVDAPRYIITELQVIENIFFAGAATCEKRSILITSRGDFIDQEYYDLLFLMPEADGQMVLVDKQTFEGSQGQSSTIVSVSTEDLAADKKCKVLRVNSSSEGGDVNLHKDEWLEYYIADQKSFHGILKLQIEDTDIQDFEASQDENQNSSSEIRELQMLETSSNGLFDIKVHYTSKQNGNTILDSEEFYVFDGLEYVKK